MTPELNTDHCTADRFLDELAGDIQYLKPRRPLRELRVVSCAGPMVRASDGRELINFTSNSHLGLNDHPAMKRAVVEAVEQYGTGSGASLLISGRWPIHEQTERAFAAFKHAEAALLTPTGYMANLAVLTALAGPGDLICLDKLCHASLIDAARASGAEVRTYPHLMTDKLRRLLARHAADKACGLAGDHGSPRDHARIPRRFIVTDSVFSMDGDCADLPALCDLADEFDAVTVVDEAHGTGLLGETGSGLCEAQGVTGRVHVTISTASKALGGLGGIITAARPVIDTIVNRARPVIYTTAIPPAQAAAIAQAVELIGSEPWRREHVIELTRRLRKGLSDLGWRLQPTGGHIVPIVPLIVGDAHAATKLAEHLYAHGIAAPAIRPPTVAPGSARIRLSLRADMEHGHIDTLLDALVR
ncbi:MAG: 8-amino-7-oxononanoate synthase [Phycisphaerales bacterium]